MSDVNNHDEELNEEDNIVILKDEDGNDVRFEFLDFIEYENENYIVLLPADEDAEDADEVVILKEEKETEEGENYVSVDNEETLNKVFEIFKDKFKDEFDFAEE